MKKLTLLLLIITLMAGCIKIDFLFSNIEVYYEKDVTVARFTINYGYIVNCTSNKKYNIFCMLGIPLSDYENVLSLNWTDDPLQKTISGNKILRWNISDSKAKKYNLGVRVDLISAAFLVNLSDWRKALTVEEMRLYYNSLIKQYCHNASNGSVNLIEPFHPMIHDIALSIRNSCKSNNTFIIAREVFRWLKENTEYRTHKGKGVQRASFTLMQKGGDCDDLTFLYISLCRALDIPARFVKGYMVDNGDIVAHAWAEVFVGNDIGDNGWIPVECAGNISKKDKKGVESEIYQHFGVEDAAHVRVYVDDGSNESINNSIFRIGYEIFSNEEDINIQSFKTVNEYEIIDEGYLVIYKDGTRKFVKNI